MENKYDFYCEEAISGKTPITKLYESQNVLAFHHTKPSYQTHIVITSKKHIKDLSSISDEDLVIMNEIMKVSRDLSKEMNITSGLKLVTNIGKFQDTPHLHFHLIDNEKII